MVFTCPVTCPAECCKFEREEDMPVVLEEEVARLRENGVELIFKPYAERRGVKLYRWIIEGWCPFYKGRCTIHQKKPLACKMFPLALGHGGEVYLSEKCLWVQLNGPKPLDYFPHEKRALEKLASKLW